MLTTWLAPIGWMDRKGDGEVQPCKVIPMWLPPLVTVPQKEGDTKPSDKLPKISMWVERMAVSP